MNPSLKVLRVMSDERDRTCFVMIKRMIVLLIIICNKTLDLKHSLDIKHLYLESREFVWECVQFKSLSECPRSQLTKTTLWYSLEHASKLNLWQTQFTVFIVCSIYKYLHISCFAIIGNERKFPIPNQAVVILLSLSSALFSVSYWPDAI